MYNPLDSPFLKALEDYKKESKLRFHMPGHKGRIPKEFQALKDHLYEYDVTELSKTDDLYYPSSFLMKSLEDLRKDRKSKKSFFLVNGSTVGILTAILALSQEGDTILMEENCHKSIHAGIKLGKLKKQVLPTQHHPSGIPLFPETNYVISTLKENPEIKLLVLTRPNYHGSYGELEEIIDYCKKNKIYTLIDEAHGSHFVYSDFFPKSAMECGVDISINSFHKTLPSFTQTAILNVGDLPDDLILEIGSTLEMLQSSSPSFLFLTSLDLSFRYMEKNKARFQDLRKWIEDFKKKISSLESLRPVINLKHDFTRILLFPQDTGHLLTYLEEHGVFVEMHDEHCLVLIATVMDKKTDYDSLYKILEKYDPQAQQGPQEEYSSFEEAVGHRLLEDVYIYPPGRLYLKKGMFITKEIVEKIQDLKKKKIQIQKTVTKLENKLYVEIDK